MSKFNRNVFVRNIPVQSSKTWGKSVKSAMNDFVETMWWRFLPGTVINVRWPAQVEVQLPRHPQITCVTTDPNDIYRPHLETYCGKQLVDWHWRTNGESLDIKFRPGKSRWATLFAIRWA
ncbi:hypothetical protein UFOVP116_232 [uncultured Caudovirales phage]|uniref:Uncharacterized protein n=1 Tax=uncultured Caudovirales phage TaxID=2100421 RepID=A0A6J5L7N8_9CAUD|nr:hypothetical protein UFOVP116_232 [uncultured Caudovirales phage]